MTQSTPLASQSHCEKFNMNSGASADCAKIESKFRPFDVDTTLIFDSVINFIAKIIQSPPLRRHLVPQKPSTNFSSPSGFIHAGQ
jgi:hypothetical protein